MIISGINATVGILVSYVDFIDNKRKSEWGIVSRGQLFGRNQSISPGDQVAIKQSKRPYPFIFAGAVIT